jgi:hypothetical protein
MDDAGCRAECIGPRRALVENFQLHGSWYSWHVYPK